MFLYNIVSGKRIIIELLASLRFIETSDIEHYWKIPKYLTLIVSSKA